MLHLPYNVFLNYYKMIFSNYFMTKKFKQIALDLIDAVRTRVPSLSACLVFNSAAT